MFGDDQNQNFNGQAQAAEPTAAAQPDVAASAPSAPTIPDPMVTPSAVQPEAGINGVAMQNGYIESAPQIGPAKPSEPDNVPTAASMITAAPDPATVDPDLAQIKQQALQSLGPLVGQLDQAPDEKFKTVMMLIQASDDSKMLKDAYAAASQITDEKTRAQALLDIVNEINYFTQQQAKS
jgi:hypothetical protein